MWFRNTSLKIAAAVICSACFASETPISASRDHAELVVSAASVPAGDHQRATSDMAECVKGVTLQGAEKLSQNDYDFLKKSWCTIARKDRELSSHIVLTDDFNAATVSGMGVETHLVFGNQLLGKAINSGRKDAVLFVLAHELGHYRMHHSIYRNIASAAVVILFSLSLLIGLILKSKKIVAIGLLLSLALYCLAFSLYKWNETSADQFAVEHLREIGIDPSGPALSFLELMESERIDTIDTKCLSLEQISSSGSLSIAARNPHPSLSDRSKSLRSFLAPLRLANTTGLRTENR
jgi:hypothetical protein